MRVTVEKLTHGGQGLARTPEGVVFVPYTIPGETWEVAISAHHKSYLEAHPVELLEASPERIEPLCVHFGDCGGCQLQHMFYEAQLKHKRAILAETLHRLGSIVIDVEQITTIPATNPFGYRRRVELQSMQLDGKPRVGFFRPRSRELVTITRCPVLETGLVDTVAQFGERFEYLASSLPANDNVRRIGFWHAAKSQRSLIALGLRRFTSSPDVKRLAREIENRIENIYATWLPGSSTHAICAEMDEEFTTTGEPYPISYRPDVFYQVNRAQNQSLKQIIAKEVQHANATHVLDLYAGYGNLSLSLAANGFSIQAVEISKPAATLGERIADHLSCSKRFNIASMTATQFLERRTANRSFDLILLDPPRQGCKHLIAPLCRLKASSIIYVACDPAALARDLARLATCGFHLQRLYLIDMFPQTAHMESVAVVSTIPSALR